MLVKCHVTFHLSTVAAAEAASQLQPVPQQKAVRMDDGIQPCGTAFFQKKVPCSVKPREKSIVFCKMDNNIQQIKIFLLVLCRVNQRVDSQFHSGIFYILCPTGHKTLPFFIEKLQFNVGVLLYITKSKLCYLLHISISFLFLFFPKHTWIILYARHYFLIPLLLYTYHSKCCSRVNYFVQISSCIKRLI